ncbi:MAG: hypothetical protein LQ337_004633 [Flavoplaca oasis]|nr:MAG: hypothetical protein LQ337_004633 [Flavoplaca oasis]
MKRPQSEPDSVVTLKNLDGSDSRKAKRRKVEKANSLHNVDHNVKQNILSKAEKRELKKLHKLEKEREDKDLAPQNGDPVVLEKKATGDPARAAAKAARKAEKARLTVEKAKSPDGIMLNGSKDDNMKAEVNAKRKEARRLKKEEKKATEQTTLIDVTVIPNGNSEPKAMTPKNDVLADYIEDPDLTALEETEIQSFLLSNYITIKNPSSQHPLRPITRFSYLPKSSYSSAFSSFSAPTAIQASAWPFLLSGRDVVGVAETGSGKTLAFGIPCIRSVSSTKSSKTPARAVIISPTRELAVQIHTQMQSLCTSTNKIYAACVYGGVAKDPQRLALSTAHIVVATPGRLLDLIEEGSADLSEVRYLVLDEADRMLEKGFENEIRKIVATTPSTSQGRQTLMFTATWPESVRELAATFMKTPVHIHIGENNDEGELRANTRIEQKVEVVDPRDKETRMLQIIKKYQSGKAKNDRILVFCLYKKEATRVEGFLRSRGLRVAGIHGDLSQERRMAALEGFKSGECPLLVATDVAARGLDIPAVKLVLNVTFPLTVEDYVHRIGRTGRAGALGLAITLFTEHDKSQSGALINVLKAAGQAVPDDLLKFGTTVKKKGHEAYGAFYKDTGDAKTATKIRFD